MTFVIGRGRYARSVYPVGGSAAGGDASIAPLARQKFIDGNSSQTGNNGSAGDPFTTIAAFIASRPSGSTEDVNTNYVGWLMPRTSGYSEDVAFPPYASTELRATSVADGGSSGGMEITGDFTWANVAGPAAGPTAAVSVFNVRIIGDFTVTDDVNAPPSQVLISGDNPSPLSASLGGVFDSSACTKLGIVSFVNAVAGDDVVCGTNPNSATVVFYNSQCTGEVSALGIRAVRTVFSGASLTCADTGPAIFQDCAFQFPGQLLTCFAGATFDGTSWDSFMEAGGTRSSGTIVLVVGGYRAGDVPGAPLTGISTSVSLNGTGATAGFTGSDSGNHYTCSSPTPASVTMLTGGGESTGDTMCISKTNLGANAIAVINGGPGAGTIGTIPANSRGFVVARFDGTNWIFSEGGSMVA